MRRGGAIAGAVLLSVATLACSESEPTATTDPTAASPTAEECEGDALLDCARASTIGDLVPDEATAASGEPLRVGMVNQENTTVASFPELSQAVQAAIAFVNEQLGGVDGRPLELSVCNTRFSAEGSTASAQRFVDEGVPAVLGGIDVFGNAVDTLADNDIPYVGGIPVSTQSVESPNSFQWSGGTWGATVAFADHSVRVLEAERVAIVYGEFASITQSAEYGRKVLEDAGVEVQLVPFPILETDITAPLTAAAANRPDAIFALTADSGCKPAMEAAAALDIETQVFYVGACAAPTIINDVDAAVTDGAIFNVEGPIDREDPGPDSNLYAAVINRYGEGLDPVGAGTVTFRAFMNFYAVLRELGAEGITASAITESLSAKVDEPSFTGHPYTCDGQQFEGLPGMCSPQQILAVMEDRNLTQVGDWIDVGAVYAG